MSKDGLTRRTPFRVKFVVKTKLTATGEGFDTYFYGNDKLAKKLIRHLHPSRKDHAKKYCSSSCINLGWDSQARRGKKYQIVSSHRPFEELKNKENKNTCLWCVCVYIYIYT